MADWFSTAIVDPSFKRDKENLVVEFEKYQIDMRPLFYSVSSMPPFERYTMSRDMSKINPVTYTKSKFGVCLPNGNNLSAKDVAYVCCVFGDILIRV